MSETRREAFLKKLAEQIKIDADQFARENPKASKELNEPYLVAGDSLVDDALELID
jgi:hypothetical protein